MHGNKLDIARDHRSSKSGISHVILRRKIREFEKFHACKLFQSPEFENYIYSRERLLKYYFKTI